MGKLIAVKGRVLVVDDDSVFCGSLVDMLTSVGYGAVCVSSVSELERELCRDTFDLIILSLELPEEDGMSYLKRVDTDTLGAPVLVMTNTPQLTVAVESFKEGAADCIFKPFTQGQLMESIDRSMENEPVVEALDKTIVANGDTVTNVAGYPLEEILGQGNMGIVYLVSGTDTVGTPCKYALKVLKPPVIGDPVELEKIEKRFMSEARATYQIMHPNVVGTYDFGLCDKHIPYILMEYCPGLTLAELIDKGTLSLPEKYHILLQVAYGMHAIHLEKMCHRDIKPSNIIVDDDLTAKIADFGLVRLGDSNLTMTSDVFGTPAYLSPEAFFTAKVDFRSDQFSFGCTAYELIVGKAPFPGESVCAVAKNICELEPPWPREIDSTIPKALDDVIRQALQKNPEKRFDDTADIVKVLESLLEG